MARRRDTYCLLGPECALCRWRRIGHLVEPLTAAEWNRAFRNAREGIPDDYGWRRITSRLPHLPL